MSETFQFIAKTQFGLEEVLAGELAQCGATDILVINRAVSFRGGLSVMYAANYCCRTALHVLMPVLDFKFRDKEQFFAQIKAFPWAGHFTPEKTLSVDTVMSDSIFSNSHYVSLYCKDAIVDYFRDNFGKRPSVALDNPDIKIHVHIRGHECSVSLDSSGDSLHRRGYRVQQGAAPMSEVLAAGMLLLSGWDRKTHLFDPMCGSGTLLTEAAMIASNIPAGYYRRSFGFRNWSNFDEALWKQVKQTADDAICDPKCEITGSDRSEVAIMVADKNIRSAKLHKDIELIETDFQTFLFPKEKGFIITNPPYGERIKTDDIIELYKEIGNTLKNHCAGYTAWIISSHSEALKFVGLKPSKKIPLFNGPLECRFVKFEIFEGSLKAKKEKENSGDAPAGEAAL
ncbi:MAG: THUMP domain-containing protein [Bacteroidota bacterium]